MADVTGPIASLPGASHSVPKGMKCDDCENTATHRMQGETDSFGCEMHDLCDSCYAKVQASIAEHAAEAATGICEWCKQPATDLRPRRDFEEGQAGRVYDVCGACVKRENDALEAERGDYTYGDED